MTACGEHWHWRQCVLDDGHEGAHRAIDGTERIAMDVWLRFAHPADEEAEYEANTYAERPDDEHDWHFIVEWYHNAVGQVTREQFGSYTEASAWLTNAGYDDYTSEMPPVLPPPIERDIDDDEDGA